jgi:hypothetical protein
MSKARQLADLLDASGDVVTGALDNVPPSNDASALTTGTLDNARLPSGTIVQVKHFISDNEFVSSSTSFVNTNLITASFDNSIQSGSKVYATMSVSIGEAFNSAWAQPVYLTLYQGTNSDVGSNIGDSTRGIVGGNAISNADTQNNVYDLERLSGSILHTPSNTNPYYRLFMRSHSPFPRYIGSPASSTVSYNVGRTMVTIFEVVG